MAENSNMINHSASAAVSDATAAANTAANMNDSSIESAAKDATAGVDMPKGVIL